MPSTRKPESKSSKKSEEKKSDRDETKKPSVFSLFKKEKAEEKLDDEPTLDPDAKTPKAKPMSTPKKLWPNRLPEECALLKDFLGELPHLWHIDAAEAENDARERVRLARDGGDAKKIEAAKTNLVRVQQAIGYVNTLGGWDTLARASMRL